MTFDPSVAKSVFLHAMELRSEAERLDFIGRSCAGQPELLARVEQLLKTARDPDSLLERPIAEIDATQIIAADSSPVPLDFLESSDQPASLGRLAGYEILDVVGRGGMGIVLRAMDPKLQRVVAIKVLIPELAANPQARRRFLREAQAAAAVCHDHVVTIHGVSDDVKLPFIIMECIIGQSLQQKIDRRGALGVTEILRIGMQIAAGLSAAHKQGLVHRDIKPANILLENGVERVKITDFGLARASDDVGITQAGQIAGTPQYMSPEQAMGQPLDQRSDLFSLGSVLYTMCTGRPAFRGDSTVAVLRHVCDETPRPIHELNAEIPAWLIGIVDKLMAKNPADRIQTAQELSLLLEQWLAHCQQPATVPRPDPVIPPSAWNFTGPSITKPGRFWQRIDRRWIRIGTSSLAGLLLSASALYLFHPPFYSWCHRRAQVRIFSDTEITPSINDVSLGVVTDSHGFNVAPGPFRIEVRPRPNQQIREIQIEQHSGWPWKPGVVLKREFAALQESGLPFQQSFPVRAGESWTVRVHAMDKKSPTIESGSFGAKLADAEFNATDAKWVSLFSGRDLAGWKTFDDAPGEWRVKDGILTGQGPFSYLYTERGDYRDFHLRAEVRINAKGDSGIIFRSPFQLFRYPTTSGVKGYEAQIQARTQSGMNTGALAVVRPNGNWELVTPMFESVVPPSEWCTLQILARGDRIAIKVNELVTAVYTDKEHSYTSGHIALQQSTPQTLVQFRKIEIRELPSGSLPARISVAPYDERQAASHQAQWAKKLGMAVETTDSRGIKLRLIPPGRFAMGSTPEDLAELRRELDRSGASDFDKFVAESSAPRHFVELTEPFYMSQYEVTVAQFRQFIDETGYQASAERAGNAPFTWKNYLPETGANVHPVCGVSWEDAKAFCAWLNGKATDQKLYDYDLPTEAQWEYACRAGSPSLWSFGDDPALLPDSAITGMTGQPGPAEIGLRRPNAFGLFDMHGNVGEWCRDWHNREFYGRSPVKDPVNDETPEDAASGRVARGGSWNSDGWWSRSATRTYDFPVSPTFARGFRIVCKVRQPVREVSRDAAKLADTHHQ